MKSLLNALRDNLADARALGPRFVLRHLPGARRKGEHSWTMPGLGEITVRHGTTDTEVFRQVFRQGEYDLSKLGRMKQVTGWYEEILAAGRTPLIIDAGANIGAASLWLARQFPLARLIAVEPEPANAALCRRNLAHNPRLSVREAAIGAVPGRIELVNPAAKAWSPRSRRSDGADGIEIVTIPDLVASVQDADLLVVKIDIEGFESDLFSSNLGWLDRARVVMIEIHDWMMPGRRTSRALQKAMGEREFEMMINGENLIYINCEPPNQAAAAPARSELVG